MKNYRLLKARFYPQVSNLIDEFALTLLQKFVRMFLDDDSNDEVMKHLDSFISKDRLEVVTILRRVSDNRKLAFIYKNDTWDGKFLRPCGTYSLEVDLQTCEMELFFLNSVEALRYHRYAYLLEKELYMKNVKDPTRLEEWAVLHDELMIAVELGVGDNDSTLTGVVPAIATKCGPLINPSRILFLDYFFDKVGKKYKKANSRDIFPVYTISNCETSVMSSYYVFRLFALAAIIKNRNGVSNLLINKELALLEQISSELDYDYVSGVVTGLTNSLGMLSRELIYTNIGQNIERMANYTTTDSDIQKPVWYNLDNESTHI